MDKGLEINRALAIAILGDIHKARVDAKRNQITLGAALGLNPSIISRCLSIDSTGLGSSIDVAIKKGYLHILVQNNLIKICKHLELDFFQLYEKHRHHLDNEKNLVKELISRVAATINSGHQELGLMLIEAAVASSLETLTNTIGQHFVTDEMVMQNTRMLLDTLKTSLSDPKTAAFAFKALLETVKRGNSQECTR